MGKGEVDLGSMKHCVIFGNQTLWQGSLQRDLFERGRTDRHDGGPEAELRPERLRLSLEAGAQQRGSQAVSREGSREGKGDDGAGEQAQGGERDARGQDQATL